MNPETLVNLMNPANLVFVNSARLAAAIVPAVGTHAVRRFLLVAVRALAQAGGFERVMRTALGRSRLGVSSFGIRHRESLSIDRDARPLGPARAGGPYQCDLRRSSSLSAR